MIGTLIISKTTGLPGDGFIIDGGAKKIEYGGSEYQSRVEEEQKRICAHSNWEKLRQEFGLPLL